MANEPDPNPTKKPLRTDVDDSNITDQDTYAALQKASSRGSIFGRFNTAFTEVLQSSRGVNRVPEPVVEQSASISVPAAPVSADDLALRRAKSVKAQKMIVPEGVIISGSMSSSAETEISGRVDGDVFVDGNLFLGSTALISGNVRASNCRVEGLVEGKVECTNDLDLGGTGRLNADAQAGKRISLAGQVLGNVVSGGVIRIEKSARITGDIRARRFVMEEGAILNGVCSMRVPNQAAPKE